MSFDEPDNGIADEWERVARDARAEVGAPDDLDGPALLARVLEELRRARAMSSSVVADRVRAVPRLAHADVASDVDLLRTALLNAHRDEPVGRQLWVTVRCLTGHGSGVGTAICRALDLDPDMPGEAEDEDEDEDEDASSLHERNIRAVLNALEIP